MLKSHILVPQPVTRIHSRELRGCTVAVVGQAMDAFLTVQALVSSSFQKNYLLDVDVDLDHILSNATSSGAVLATLFTSPPIFRFLL
jgi:hypothetical protein